MGLVNSVGRCPYAEAYGRRVCVKKLGDVRLAVVNQIRPAEYLLARVGHFVAAALGHQFVNIYTPRTGH